MSVESTEIVTAVTGKPLEHYEAYVGLIAKAFAGGLVLATDRDFQLSLDQAAPLEQAVREQAREFIRWRLAFDIDEIEDQS